MEEKQALRAGTPQDYGGTVAFHRGEEDDSATVVLQGGQVEPATRAHAAEKRHVLTDEVHFEKKGNESGTVVFGTAEEEPPVKYIRPYEQTLVRKLNGNSSVYGAVFIVINAAFGAGLLAFPYAFFLAGGKDNVVGGVITELVRPVLEFLLQKNLTESFLLHAGTGAVLYCRSDYSLVLLRAHAGINLRDDDGENVGHMGESDH